MTIPNHAQPDPTESREQQSLFEWAAWMSNLYPVLNLLYHIPNEGKRSRAAGGRLKAEGLRPGVPDICLPVPSPPYSGLYIEMKSRKGTPTIAQSYWLHELEKVGNRAVICYSFEEATLAILDYLHIEGSAYHVK